jgi:hypothetical protein
MAVIFVRTRSAGGGSELPGTALRTGSAQAAVDHALKMKATFPPPDHVTTIHYNGSFVDDAFAELAQLSQVHGLQFESGDG